MMNKNEFTFPFDTCESPKSKFFAQPYSVFVNACSTLVVFYFLCKTRTTHAFLLLLSLLLFNISHTFSHFMHIQSRIQVTIVHVLAFLLNITFFYALYKHTNKAPTLPFLLLLLGILSFDIYAFLNLPLLFYLFTFILFFVSVFLYYYSSLSATIKKSLLLLVVFIGIDYLGFVNEAMNCKKMLKYYPHFLFHAIIEVFILVAVYLFCETFYKI